MSLKPLQSALSALQQGWFRADWPLLCYTDRLLLAVYHLNGNEWFADALSDAAGYNLL